MVNDFDRFWYRKMAHSDAFVNRSIVVEEQLWVYIEVESYEFWPVNIGSRSNSVTHSPLVEESDQHDFDFRFLRAHFSWWWIFWVFSNFVALRIVRIENTMFYHNTRLFSKCLDRYRRQKCLGRAKLRHAFGRRSICGTYKPSVARNIHLLCNVLLVCLIFVTELCPHKLSAKFQTFP